MSIPSTTEKRKPTNLTLSADARRIGQAAAKRERTSLSDVVETLLLRLEQTKRPIRRGR